MKPATSHFLDAARWLAAFAVVACHACGLLLVNETQVTGPDLSLRLLFCLENAGHVAVIVFFVISGFLVGGQEALRMTDGRQFGLARYAIQRFSRIYTVLIPALAATWAFDRAGLHLFNGSAIYTESLAQHFISLTFIVALRDDLRTFICNLLMLQTIMGPPFGSNGPLWSLANEWWYYVLWMLGLAFWSRNRHPRWRFASLAAMLVLFVVLPASITWWLAFWLLGAAIAMLDRHWRGIGFRPAVGVMLAGFGLALYGATWQPALGGLPAKTQLAFEWLLDLITALGFALALLSAKNAGPAVWHRLHARLAGFSYTLYLVHFPALLFACALLHDMVGLALAQPPTVPRAGLVVAVLAGVCAYGWGFAQLTERHTPAIRRLLTRLLSQGFHVAIGKPALVAEPAPMVSLERP